jgi:hypothetical protein
MYRKLLDQIREQKGRFGETMQPPCLANGLEKLRGQAKQQLSFELPEQYLEFLSVTDGLEWNGLCVLASERGLIAGRSNLWIAGFVGRNCEERVFDARMLEYVVFAEDGEVSFAFNIMQERYEMVSRVARSVYESFKSFGSLLERAMRDSL